MSKTDQLNALFENWRKHYTQHGIKTEDFNCDGIISEDYYLNAPKKLLFVLREPNQTLSGDLRQDVERGPDFQLWYELSRWAYGIIHNFPDFDIMEKDGPGKKEAFLGIAIINMKKIAGGGSTDFNELNVYAFLDKEFIKKEIAIIDPEIIICCNTFIELMWALELRDVQKHISDPETVFKKVYNYENCPIYIFPYHPAHRKSRRKSYNDLKEIFRRSN
jgi:hypothetical protein